MLRVGLTGSIAVGKSFVSGVLIELGCHVIDSDELARKVVEPGAVGLGRVVEAFGAGVVRDDGTLDRAALGAVVFGSEEKRRLLNSILHPLIMAEQDALRRGYGQEDVRVAVFAVVAFLDESILNSQNPMFADWPRRPLQLELFGVQIAGEIFFRQRADARGGDDLSQSRSLR